MGHGQSCSRGSLILIDLDQWQRLILRRNHNGFGCFLALATLEAVFGSPAAPTALHEFMPEGGRSREKVSALLGADRSGCVDRDGETCRRRGRERYDGARYRRCRSHR
jgi:hypothetical protein